MFERLQKKIRYKVLRSRVAKLSLNSMDFSTRELEILSFVKGVLRGHDSIIISHDLIKITKGSISMSMEDGRLISVDENRYLDVKVGEPVKRAIMEYARKVAHHKSFLFSKLCDKQVFGIINDFQTAKVEEPCKEEIQ